MAFHKPGFCRRIAMDLEGDSKRAGCHVTHTMPRLAVFYELGGGKPFCFRRAWAQGNNEPVESRTTGWRAMMFGWRHYRPIA